MHTLLCCTTFLHGTAYSKFLNELPADVGHFGLNFEVMIMEGSQQAKRGKCSLSTGGCVFAERCSEMGGSSCPIPAELGMSAGIMTFCYDE